MKLNAINMTEMESYANNKVLSNLYILHKHSKLITLFPDTKECSIGWYYSFTFIQQEQLH